MITLLTRFLCQVYLLSLLTKPFEGPLLQTGSFQSHQHYRVYHVTLLLIHPLLPFIIYSLIWFDAMTAYTQIMPRLTTNALTRE